MLAFTEVMGILIVATVMVQASAMLALGVLRRVRAAGRQDDLEARMPAQPAIRVLRVFYRDRRNAVAIPSSRPSRIELRSKAVSSSTRIPIDERWYSSSRSKRPPATLTMRVWRGAR